MADGDVYRAEIYYNIGSELTMNVMHLKEIVTSTDEIPAETVALAIEEMLTNTFGIFAFSSQAWIIAIIVRRIAPTSGVPAYLILGTTAHPVIAGQGVSTPVPSAAAVLISLYTAVNSASGRGRVYIPGLNSVGQNDGQLTEATFDELAPWVDALESDIVAVGPGTGEWHFAVWSRTLSQANEVTQAILHTNMATQRGRRNFPGIGG